MTCDTERLFGLDEGLLDSEVLTETEAHLEECPDCRATRRALAEERVVVQAAFRQWLETLPETRSARSRPFASVLAAAALVLVAASLLLFSGTARVPEFDVPAAPLPGSTPPPSAAQLLFLTDLLVEVKVTKVEKGVIHADREKVLHGSRKDVPEKLRLKVPRAVTGVGVQTVKAAKGDLLIILFRMKDKALQLVTKDASSVVTKTSMVYLETADLHRMPYGERKAGLKNAIGLLARLRKMKWKDQEKLLAAAVSGRRPIAREVAICWYSHHRTGFPSPDVSYLPEERDLKPHLPAVDDALLLLVPPRRGRLGTLSSRAARLLVPRGPKPFLELLVDPARGEPAYLMLQKLGKTAHEAIRDTLAADDPTLTYLARALLATPRDKGALYDLLAEEVRKESVPNLSRWRHVPVWPPLKFVGWMVRKDFRTVEEARRWLSEEE